MTDKPMTPQLWTDRSVDDTIAVYRDWAASYDADLGGGGYHTPLRLAQALQPHLPSDALILDFGCGTGISGAALRAVGFTRLHGVDITPEMLDRARPKAIYDDLRLSQPGTVPAQPGTYAAIVATGVISLGAAPPETLNLLIDALARGGLIALSFNDPTLADGRYDTALQAQVDAGMVTVLSRAHGPHLDGMNMGSDVIVLKRL
ncbi:class I SAM-dependent DNA methyltransferase [Actibacterium ureilyticum]|uniref:class I SAM-dependent DNA methyltransferase n=1 Tax=Actibacterium ureilyticum TaxID=1590614 RepID=UPI000BAAA082|nr:methyltransferase domain-containing protein [Actibacterium ureilyticum]